MRGGVVHEEAAVGVAVESDAEIASLVAPRPMVIEAAVAMQACARIGAVHSVIFGGFSAQSVADRVQDCGAKMIITSDGSYRRGSIVPLKQNVDDALKIKIVDPIIQRPICQFRYPPD